ncbi:1182_t:CDS:10 [Entrophospora sp. SA101]|nr:1182_t:CDS:10 [Entrophospora sp. SA101]
MNYEHLDAVLAIGVERSTGIVQFQYALASFLTVNQLNYSQKKDTDEYDIWKNVANEFRTHLPLRNLNWKSAKGATRNIQTLNIELKRFTPETTEKQHMMPETLLEKPYLNLYFVNCDDNETYRQSVRTKIRDWLNLVTSKRNQEWLIVYVTNNETIKNAARYFRMQGTVFDKIKADFNASKRERCVQLRLSGNDNDDYESWHDIISKIKEGILSSFDQHVVQYEEDIRRFDSQRSMIGWNYCRFFILKEGLALTFEIMNLCEEALVQYDEALAWFGSFGATEPEDDSANILDVKKKQYRDLIMQNTIPEFDFRCYLFARQCQLLGRLQRPVDICRRAQLFISTFARAIREHQANIGEQFLESWIFSSCMSVVNEWLRHGHLPSIVPFTTSLGDVTPPASPDSENEKKIFTITNYELQKAIASISDFDLLYLSLTNRALKAYEGSTRLRSSLRLQADVAALQFHRKNYDSAVKLMEDLPWRYNEQGWTLVENTLLNHTLLTQDEANFYANEVKQFSNSIEEGKEITRAFKTMFTVSVTTLVDDITDEDSPYLFVELTNHLQTPFTFDKLAVRLVSGQSEEIWFVVLDQDLSPGQNKYKLYSDVIHIGEQQCFAVKIYTGLTSVTEGNLTLEPVSEGLSFPTHEKYHASIKSVKNDDEILNETLEEVDLIVTEKGEIILPSSPPNQLIEFRVPYDCSWGAAIEHKVKISIEYESRGKPRAFTSVDTVKVWLPLSMDITLNGTLPIRILDTKLVSSKVYGVIDDPALESSSMFDHKEHTKTASTQVHFVVTYKSLQDEIEKYAEYILNKILKSKDLLQHSRFVIDNAKNLLLKYIDFVSYGMTDSLDLVDLDIELCEKIFSNHGNNKEDLIDVIKEFWMTCNQTNYEEVFEITKDLKSSISFPVNVPSSKVLNTVELIISKSHDLLVGEPCHCRLIVKHSSYWNYASSTDHKDSLEFFYDVNIDFDNWLLAETKEFPITLVPLKTGNLLVPLIRIASLSSNIFSETVYLNNAEQVLVRPRTQSATFFIEQQHRIHSIHSTGGFSGPGHHHNEGLVDVEID